MNRFGILRIKKERGFTLIELMIVVAIIGVLAAIAIPNFRNYQLKTKRQELPTNLKAIRTAELSYQAEFHTFQQLTSSPAGVANNQKRTWTDQGGFNTIGWAPTGNVYGSYYSVGAVTPTTITGMTHSNLDNDGANATYTFVANISNATLSTAPTHTSQDNIF